MSKNQRIDKLRQMLMRRPTKTSAILDQLGISQPTFSRLWATVNDGIVLGAGKARQYALQRQIAGVDVPIPVFRITEHGQATAIAYIHSLQGGWYALTPLEGTDYQLFEGLPFFLTDLRPQGFLGRMEPGRQHDLGLPADITKWADEHVLKYIARRSEYAPGNLILGNESYARYLAGVAEASRDVIPAVMPDVMRTRYYPEMAERSMQGEPPGSSAGGEQPKFTAIIERTGDASGDVNDNIVEHVIVKFSPPIGASSGRRWADLLICEHLALEVLHRNRIAAARTSILAAGERVFLEVVRFDRLRLRGRLPMATFSALDGDLGMLDQNWSMVARELRQRGELSEQDMHTVEILDLYGTLIGNTDRHHGNIAVAWTFDRQYQLLDAYDMLPMYYRPNTHGEIVEREWAPNLGARLALQYLPQCYDMAIQFWADVIDDARISEQFKENVAQRHLTTMRVLGALGDEHF